MFAAVALEAVQRVSEFNAQELTNAAWAFARAHESAPAIFDPISVLDAIEAQGIKPEVKCYDLRMP